MIEEQTNGEQKISHVAHPRQISQSAESPVVHNLREEKNQRQKTDRAKACRGPDGHTPRISSTVSFRHEPAPEAGGIVVGSTASSVIKSCIECRQQPFFALDLSPLKFDSPAGAVTEHL